MRLLFFSGACGSLKNTKQKNDSVSWLSRLQAAQNSVAMLVSQRSQRTKRPEEAGATGVVLATNEPTKAAKSFPAFWARRFAKNEVKICWAELNWALSSALGSVTRGFFNICAADAVPVLAWPLPPLLLLFVGEDAGRLFPLKSFGAAKEAFAAAKAAREGRGTDDASGGRGLPSTSKRKGPPRAEPSESEGPGLGLGLGPGPAVNNDEEDDDEAAATGLEFGRAPAPAPAPPPPATVNFVAVKIGEGDAGTTIDTAGRDTGVENAAAVVVG